MIDDNWGYDSIEDMLEAVIMGDESAPTDCEHGCEVEPDGCCPHGSWSALRVLGLI